MTTNDILTIRLYNQQLTQKKFKTPWEVVSWFGAMQAQDYSSAKWGLGQRLEHASDEPIEKAFNEGKILRIHVMRPTWHFVTPQDIKWMLALTASRVHRMLNTYDRRIGVDEDLLKRSYGVLRKVLKNGNVLTRTQIADKLHKNGINVKGQALGHVVGHAELDGFICSGPRIGKQFTYALLEEKVPKTKVLTRDESLAELTKRYFQSHGPATEKDFSWWSGLTIGDVRKGIELNKAKLVREEIDGKTYWLYPFTAAKDKMEVPKTAYLLPNYDEYGIAYTYRDAFFNPRYTKHLGVRGNANFQHMIVYEGRIIGTWKRTLKKNSVAVEAKFFSSPSKVVSEKVKNAAVAFGKFIGSPATLV